MWKVLINDEGLYSIEVRFNTVDNREWYLCTESHTDIRAAFNQLMTVPITGLDHSYDRVRWATVVHEVKVSLGIPSPGPLPRLYQQVQWKVRKTEKWMQYNALDDRGKTDHNLLCVQVYHNGTVQVHDTNGMIHEIYDYPGATLYEKFLNIPTIFPNVE